MKIRASKAKKVGGEIRNHASAAVSQESKFLERLRLVEEAAIALFICGVVLVIFAGSLPPRSLTGAGALDPVPRGGSSKVVHLTAIDHSTLLRLSDHEGQALFPRH